VGLKVPSFQSWFDLSGGQPLTQEPSAGSLIRAKDAPITQKISPKITKVLKLWVRSLGQIPNIRTNDFLRTLSTKVLRALCHWQSGSSDRAPA
jgi:hypothetical protein